ncbi:alpha-hydroxy acid oxidase [Nakamurella leprariae]|uniref:Alpha-hydroxy-acid oxidizing protein n=1 Tax=Nakamurella leprariae TaxID=2803911 RepID=A0A939BYF0_9ACTN|nr:alpha-hydroxy acid oxidase [Nakamurella leprariae]MBM9466541.1 alpha-hydroxy-acid oxidizing protein [Nakamurella leprariae]
MTHTDAHRPVTPDVAPPAPAGPPAGGRPHGPRRQVPRWSELRPLLRTDFSVPTRAARVRRAATVDDLRTIARRHTPRSVFDYVDGSAETERSTARALAAFERVEFRPKVLRDVSQIDLTTTVLGRPAAMPLILAPTGFTRMMQHQGEFAVGAAAAAAGLPYTLSTMGTVSPERLAVARAQDPQDTSDLWMQLYLWQDREASRDLIARAAEHGYRALMLTVDTPVGGARLRDVRNGLTIPPSLTLRTLGDMSRHPSWWANLLTTEPLTFASLSSTGGTVSEMVDRVFDPRAGLDDLAWLRSIWSGPLIIKGVQTAADARMVVDAGADAVVISNHGGRQLDRATTPLEELPAVLDAVGDDTEVYLDGGVRSGADVAAAVALGARAVLVGRAYLYGLMAGGQDGVARALEILRTDLRRTMALLGVTRIEDLTREVARLREHG